MRFVNRPLLRWSEGRWFGVHLDPFDRGVMEQLKTIPIRAWDSDTKTWWFPETFFHHVKAALESSALYGDVKDILAEGSKKLKRPAWRENDPYDVLGVTRDALPCVVEAAFKALVRELDPERNLGASTEPADKVRWAYEQITGQ